VTLSWTDWFVGFLPVGLTLLVLTPTLLFSLYPPEVKSAPEAPKWAAEELTKLGRMTAREYALLGLVLAILGLWIAGAGSVDTTMAALVGVAAMVLLGIVSWDDILANKQAWNVLVWFATLVTLAGGLAQVKFVEWVGKTLGPLFAGLPPALVIAVVVGSFFVLHYLFASVTAHDGAIAGVSHRRRRAAGAVAEGVGAHADLYVRHHGYPDAVCDGPVADLLRQRLHQGQGFLDARGDLGAAFLAALIVIGVPWLRLLGV
jgi:L-tartrate/succinate antiporter